MSTDEKLIVDGQRSYTNLKHITPHYPPPLLRPPRPDPAPNASIFHRMPFKTHTLVFPFNVLLELSCIYIYIRKYVCVCVSHHVGVPFRKVPDGTLK